MVAFFDRALSEREGVAFIREDRIDEMLLRLIPGAKITKGAFAYPSRAELRDLAWNHMDQNHRPYIHNTYDDAARIFIDERAAFSLTRFGNWPIVLPVFDGYFKENGFYQIVSLFGLFLIISIIECDAAPNGGTQMRIRWLIASSRLLGWLHPALNRRLRKLNEVQNREDDPIRDRRVAMRAANYRFRTDIPNFINANVIDDNTMFPPLAEGMPSIELDELTDGAIFRKDLGDRAFLFRRHDARVEVWPGTCVHEGAELASQNIAGTMVKCPWHGLEFPARLLSEGQAIELCGARISLTRGRIEVASLAAGTPQSAG